MGGLMSKRIKGSDATIRIEGYSGEFKVRDFTWNPVMDARVNPDAHRAIPFRRTKADRIAEMNETLKADRARRRSSGCTCRVECAGFCGIDRGVHPRSYAKPSIEMRECPGCGNWQDSRTGHDCPTGLRGDSQ